MRRCLLFVAAFLTVLGVQGCGVFEECDGEYVAQVDRTTECVEYDY